VRVGRLAAVALLGVLGVGCAPYLGEVDRPWVRAGTPVPEATRDETHCARRAHAVGGARELVVGGVVDAVRAKMEHWAAGRDFERCLAGRGYRPRGEG
jgi:hypothetical protein